MSALVALIALLLGPVAWDAPRAEPLSMTEFRDAYSVEVRREHPEDKVRIVADDELEITTRDHGPITAFIDNAYNFYLTAPDQLDDILRRYVSLVYESAQLPKITADKLLVLVRPASYAEAQAPMAAAPGSTYGPLLTRPLAGDLLAIVAVDTPSSYAFVPGSTLRGDLKMDDAAIWKAALANTVAKAPPPPTDQKTFVFSTGTGLGSSLLAEDAFWDQPEMQKGGPPVVAPISKDVLLVAHADDPKGRRRRSPNRRR
jgi:hypothetical protein